MHQDEHAIVVPRPPQERVGDCPQLRLIGQLVLETLSSEVAVHDPLRPQTSPPRTFVLTVKGPRGRRDDEVAKARCPDPRREVSSSVGLGVIVTRDLVVELQPTNQQRVVGRPHEGAVVGVSHREQTPGPQHSSHLAQRVDGRGQVLEHLMGVDHVEVTIGECEAVVEGTIAMTTACLRGAVAERYSESNPSEVSLIRIRRFIDTQKKAAPLRK